MRTYRVLVGALAKSQLREPVALFFTLVLSPMLLLGLGAIFGNDPQPQFGMSGFVDQMLPGLTVIGVVVVGIMLVPTNQLILRTSGALNRFRITPLRSRTYVAADLTVQFCLGLIGALLTLLTGILVFRVPWPTNPLLVIAALVLGAVAMLAIGYTLAALYPSVAAATGIGNGVMILLMMTSGAFIPTAVMPDGVQAVMRFSPVHHIAQLVAASWQGVAWPWVSVGVLLGCTALFGAIGTRWFRWDQAR
ncbi:ABC transporter permease [Arachnia propionica]|uniref:Transport permease protein n=1 Tax=Arachnia propionica TaxID=1750 RepID=A0A3P1T6R5_9ACTN|nr:ABC transporter permease [Arachnia propionica]RRD05142.1 ABC transporter permease [Arachnia propionica]